MSNRDKITSLSLKEFDSLWVKYTKRIGEVESLSRKECADIRAKLARECAPLLEKRKEIEKQYYIGHAYGAKVYVDRLSIGGTEVALNNGTYYDKDKQTTRRIVGYTKKGKPRYRNVTEYCLIVRCQDSAVRVICGERAANRDDFRKYLQEQIKKNEGLKEKLDARIEAIDNAICQKQQDSKLHEVAINNKYETDARIARERLNLLEEYATDEQIDYRDRHKTAFFVFLRAILGVFLFCLVLSGYSNYFICKTEMNRSYSIAINDSYDFDCNLLYDESISGFRCAQRSISGDFSRYETTELKSDGDDFGLLINGGAFEKLAVSPIIPAAVYENFDYNLDDYLDEVGSSTEMLEILNTELNTYVIEKKVEISWNFSKSDRALINQKHEEWVAKREKEEAEKEAKQKAEEEAKQKAEEEARQKAEEEARQKAEEEAKQKAEEEARKKAEEEAAQQEAQQQTQQQTNNSTTVDPSVSTDNSNLPLKAICKDGTISYQDNPSGSDYRGMCSGHGGIAQKLGRVP